MTAYAKQPSGRVAERRFGAPATEKIILYGNKKEDLMKPASRHKSNWYKKEANGPLLVQWTKDWVATERISGLTI